MYPHGEVLQALGIFPLGSSQRQGQHHLPLPQEVTKAMASLCQRELGRLLCTEGVGVGLGVQSTQSSLFILPHNVSPGISGYPVPSGQIPTWRTLGFLLSCLQERQQRHTLSLGYGWCWDFSGTHRKMSEKPLFQGSGLCTVPEAMSSSFLLATPCSICGSPQNNCQRLPY